MNLARNKFSFSYTNTLTLKVKSFKLNKQSTGIEILEKAGHRNAEVLKYEGFI